MPNWCSNQIIITGEKDKIKSVIDKIRGIGNAESNTLFQTLIGETKDPNRHFGTNWDISVDDCNGKFNDSKIIMSPKTGNTPPVRFCETLAKEYQVIVLLKYYSLSLDYAGSVGFDSTGKVIFDNDYTYQEGLHYINFDE